MSSIDQQFVEFVVKSLVSKPDAVSIERRIDEKGVLLELTVDPEDLGRVIGKRGATAQSLRTLLRALGTNNDARYNLKIVDNGEPGSHGAPSGGSNDAPRDLGDTNDNAVSDNTTDDHTTDEPVAAPEPSAKDDLADLDDDEDHKPHEHKDEGSLASKTRKELEE